MSSPAEDAPLAMQEHEARQLIDTIRVKHSTVAHEELAEIVTSLLYMTSSDLYEQSTHCILELLQNADDNRYDANILPTLTFTSEPGGLRVDCNEHGMEAEHVEAISTVRHSTKSGNKHSHGYTGEKGIGFKSVFRIADEVWISSRQYSFKFDKNRRFGMIAPVWADFPRPVMPGVTSFFLKLAEGYNQEELVKQLKDFDTRLLLFLRRVRRVSIKVLDNDGNEWSQDILKEIESDEVITTTTLNTGTSQQHFATYQHHVNNLPLDPRRLHVSSSVLSFALPMTPLPDEPLPGRQQIFALLPIREYGLRFLLDGDFVLTASRSNIDESLLWNQRLRDGLADGFLAAVDHFNRGPLKYLWPFYIPSGDVSGFLLPAKHIISTRLQLENVLESYASCMARPSSLVYVHSDKYAASSGKPFSLCSETEKKYLSAHYPKWTIKSALSLGVSSMSDATFLEDLKMMIRNNTIFFRSKSSTWHEELSEALLSLTRNHELRGELLRLPIIPLHDGTWTSAQSIPVFFVNDLDPAKLPRSIELLIVDPSVSQNYSRRTLLQALGILEIDSGRLCRYIANAHASESFHPEKFTEAELISHAAYLFKLSWTPQDRVTVDLWFATSDGGRCRGSRAYIRGEVEVDPTMARIFEKLRETSANDQFRYAPPVIRTVHDDYTKSGVHKLLLPVDARQSDLQTHPAESNAMQSWRQYLITTLHLSAIPRLVSMHRGASRNKFRLSEEFKFLFKECPVADVLRLLIENWTTYAEWLELSATQQQSQSKATATRALLEEIGAVKVMGSLGPVLLRETALPDLDLYVDPMEIPMNVLQIENHMNETLRQRLACFGVTVTNDLYYYLACLQAVSSQAFPEHDILVYLYEQIQLRFSHDENAIDLAFEENSLIYIGYPFVELNESAWWTIGKATRNRDAVFPIYPDCRTLFSWLLSSPTGDISALVKQASSISTSWSTRQILGLLTRVNTSLESMTSIQRRLAVKPLRSCAIFPVCHFLQQSDPCDVASSEDQTWFIADDAILEYSYRGIVPLLAFTAPEVKEINALLGSLNLDVRRLSRLCIKRSFPTGETQYSAQDTRFFQSRSTSFLQDLIPRTHPDRGNIHLQLQSAVVMVAPRIIERHMFRYGNEQEHIGRAQEGKIALRVISSGKELRIFITSKHSIYKRRLFPLLDSVAEHCGIKDKISLRLLDAAISDSRIDRIHNMFANAGYVGHEIVQEDGAYIPESQRQARKGGFSRIRSIDSESESCSGSEEDGSHHGKKNKLGSTLETDDRRLPFLKFTEVGHDEPINPIDGQGEVLLMQTMDPNRHLEYYGEKLLSDLFEAELGGAYAASYHWKSNLRGRAGIPPSIVAKEDTSPFILDYMSSERMVQFLLNHGLPVPTSPWFPPIFHIEVAVSGGNRGDTFVWSAAQLKRVQHHHAGLSEKGGSTQVMLLFHISNVYTEPALRVFRDPWELFNSNRLVVQGDTKFRASIKDIQLFENLHLIGATRSIPFDQHRETIAASPPSGIHAHMGSDPGGATSHQCPYRYLPLMKGELRLFILFPGQQSEPIRGMIITARSIKDAGNYRALSYEWGERKKERQIFTENGVLKIWGSLHKAIMTVREKQNVAVFWIDAICINQANDIEKTQQIRLLPEIFQHASQTVAFLGSDKRSDDAIETLLQIRAKLDGPKDWPKGLRDVPKSWKDVSKPHADDPIWQDIKALFDRTWFRRAWIVQEVVAALSVTVICGKWAVDWEDIHLAMEIVQQGSHLPKDMTASWAPFSTLSRLRELEARQRRFDLFTLLDTFHYMNSTLKRDHFFALLGLATDGNEEDFAPRYGSINFASIACQYGQAFVKQGKGVHLLRRAGIAGRTGEGENRFPSWLPDLTTKPHGRLLDLHDHGIMFNASKGVREYIDCLSSNILRANGCIVDEIVEVSKHSNGQGPKQWVKYFAEIDDMVDGLYGESRPEHSHDLKVQVPVAGALSLGELSIEDSYAAFCQNLKKARFKTAKRLNLRNSKAPVSMTSGSMQTGVMTTQEKGRQYESLLKTNIAGWKFITTKRKHCGIAPNGVKVGDLISVIGGGDVPFVIRGVPGSRDYNLFSLIAGCYVHGIMKGEALKFSGVREAYLAFY